MKSMAKYFKSKKLNRIFKKFIKRRKYRRNRKAQVIPRTVKIVLPYAETFVRSGITGMEDYQFNLNSIYDPNLSGSGHQPLGHDQYATLFGRYRVYKVKAVCRWTQAGTAGSTCALVGSNVSTPITAISDAMEQPYSAAKAFSATGGVTTISKTFNLAKITGRPSYAYRADDRYQAQFGASPGENIILHVCTGDMNVAATFQYSFSIKLLYYVELFDRVQLSQS